MSASLVARLAEQLSKGEQTVEEILSSLRSPRERSALIRCAVVSSFDRRLAESVLLSEADAAPFDEVIAMTDVEPVPRQSEVFRVRPVVRSQYWSAWWPAGGSIAPTDLPPDLRALLERLADYYGEHDQPLDLLAQRCLIQADLAKELFLDLYRQADAAFNLPKCQDLIDVLSDPDRISLLPQSLLDLRNDHSAYLRARGLWSAGYFNTAQFSEPAGVSAVYTGLLRPEGPRVLNLHAPGGRGKTMQLRWLIARRLVPSSTAGALAGGRIPCALVDFDDIDPVNATRYPWLVLLEVAAQLNDQLPSPPFSALLEENGWAMPLLRRNPAKPSRAAAASLRVQSQGARVATRVLGKFERVLAEHFRDSLVVIAFDTLEEIHLRPQGDLQALLDLVGTLLDSVRGLRLVLAGRHPVSEILGSAAERLPDMVETEVCPFTDPEADHYLGALRGIENPTTRQAIVRKAGGDPFLLAMLADVVQERPKLSETELTQYPADVIYLIRRVVNRIHEPGVRWLLRYGVVPRRLTFAFVRDVMEPYLRDAMSGRLTDDDPADDELPLDLDGEEPSFRTNVLEHPEADLGLEDLWTSLRRYASSTSWVSEVAGASDTLRFRAEVIVPMRRIVSRRKVYRRLHEAAVKYFEGKVAADPEGPVTWTREAIYHHFQLEGEAAVSYWRAALEAQGEDAERRAAIAAELLEPDYIDENGDPHAWSSAESIVDHATIIDAKFENCLALIDLAREQNLQPDDPLWNQAEKGLASGLQAEKNLGRQVIDPARKAYVLGALALKSGRPDEARAEARTALAGAPGATESGRLEVLLGDAEFALGAPGAVDSYRRALDAVRTPRRRTSIRRRIIVAQAEKDTLREAHREYEKALVKAVSAREHAELQILGADIQLRCGYATKAEASAIDAAGSGESTAARLGVAAAIARCELRHALDLAAEADTGAVEPTESSGLIVSSDAAAGREAFGLAASELMDYEDAAAALNTARSLWNSQGNVEAVARCSVASAMLEFRQIGDVKVADQHLIEAEALNLAAGGDWWLGARLLRTQLMREKGAASDAMRSIHRTLDELRSASAPPRRLIRTAVVGLNYGDEDEKIAMLDLLAEQCALITPVSARVVALAGLKDVAELPGERCAIPLARLRRLLVLTRDDRLTDLDRSMLHMTIAEVERVSGAKDVARSRIVRALSLLRQAKTISWLRPWSLALDRVGHGAHSGPSRKDIKRFVREMDSHPLLCAAFLVERAEARIANGGPGPAARDLLKEAGQYLSRCPGKDTQWHMHWQYAQASLAEDDHSGDGTALLALAGGMAIGLGLALWQRHRRRAEVTDPTTDLTRRRARVRLAHVTQGQLTVDATIPALPEAFVEHSEPRYPFSEYSDDPYSLAADFAGTWLRSKTQAEGTLGSLLLPPRSVTALRSAAYAPVEFRLQIQDRALCFLPWELARIPGHEGLVAEEPTVAGVVRTGEAIAVRHDEVTFVQAALNVARNYRLAIDGEFGPRTSEALKRYQDSVGVPSDGMLRDDLLDRLQYDMARVRLPTSPGQPASGPLVVLVQPDTKRQITAMRGKASLGVNIESLYSFLGFRVLRIEVPSARELRRVIDQAITDRDVPAILHFSGGIREQGGGIALTFLAGEWSQEALGGYRTSDEYSVTAVDSVLEIFPRESFRPLVVLDIDSPNGFTETALQLLLRNAFAADLFALGHCPAVLATGLVAQDAPKVYNMLMSFLGGGSSVLETASAVQRMEAAESGDLGSGATALFTNLPWLRPWPR
jgi:hypothetical protein